MVISGCTNESNVRPALRSRQTYSAKHRRNWFSSISNEGHPAGSRTHQQFCAQTQHQTSRYQRRPLWRLLRRWALRLLWGCSRHGRHQLTFIDTCFTQDLVGAELTMGCCILRFTWHYILVILNYSLNSLDIIFVLKYERVVLIKIYIKFKKNLKNNNNKIYKSFR